METKLTAKALNESAQYAWGGELEYLSSLVLDADSKAVMIGAGPGVMALALLEQQTEQFEFDIIDNTTHNWVQKHLESAGLLHDKIQFILQDSATWGEVYEGKPIDVLIVDGDHSYEGVLADLRAWYPHVKPNGLIFMHDVLDPETGIVTEVSRAIYTFGKLLEVVTEVGISVVYRK